MKLLPITQMILVDYGNRWVCMPIAKFTGMIRDVAGLATAIMGLIAIEVIVSNKANTAQLLDDSVRLFADALDAAVSPATEESSDG